MWQPIKTAPEGVPVLVWMMGHCLVAERSGADWSAVTSVTTDHKNGGVDDWYSSLEEPELITHFMPLPEPPKGDAMYYTLSIRDGEQDEIYHDTLAGAEACAKDGAAEGWDVTIMQVLSFHPFEANPMDMDRYNGVRRGDDYPVTLR